MKRSLLIWMLATVPVLADSVDRELALRLMNEGDWKSSGIEFRRLALHAEEPSETSGYLWLAAHQYWRAGAYRVADQLLDESEDAGTSWSAETRLLRAENSRAMRDLRTAIFYWQSLLNEADDEIEILARRRLAALQLEQRNVEASRQLLLKSPGDESAGLAALQAYEQGKDKSPRIGGLLGMIPGMGYAYAGEYANAFRSLLLNSLFIYGMVDTARNDHWGGFAVITFFEITWYTGSIYGGIDASHRYNRRRWMEAVEEIERNSGFAPDWNAVPAVSLKYRF